MRNQPWHFHLFNALYVWLLIPILMLSLPSWLGQAVEMGANR